MLHTCSGPGPVLGAGETTVAESLVGEEDMLAENNSICRSQAQFSLAVQGGHCYPCRGRGELPCSGDTAG